MRTRRRARPIRPTTLNAPVFEKNLVRGEGWSATWDFGHEREEHEGRIGGGDS
jgi:hypothetical protein